MDMSFYPRFYHLSSPLPNFFGAGLLQQIYEPLLHWEIVFGSCLKNIFTLVSILQLSGSANVHLSRVWDCLFLTYYWDCFCKKLHQKCLFDRVLNTLLIGHHQILFFFLSMIYLTSEFTIVLDMITVINIFC